MTGRIPERCDFLIARATKKVSRSVGGTIPIVLLLVVIGILMVIPFLYAVLQSLKPLEEIYIFPPRFWVTKPTTDNFKQLFKLTLSLWVPFWRYLFNSVYIAVLCTAVQVIVASMAAYPLAKYSFKGRNVIFNIVVIALLFTGEVVFLPQYILISWMGLVDSHWALILPSVAYPMGLYLMRQNMMSFPDSIIEAARIDGAKERCIFWRIIMPNMKPAWMTMIVFSFGAMWSRSDTSYIYSEQLKSLPTLLTQISASGVARAGAGAAAAVLLMIPPIVIFLITQSRVMETMVNSGMKE